MTTGFCSPVAVTLNSLAQLALSSAEGLGRMMKVPAHLLPHSRGDAVVPSDAVGGPLDADLPRGELARALEHNWRHTRKGYE